LCFFCCWFHFLHVKTSNLRINDRFSGKWESSPASGGELSAASGVAPVVGGAPLLAGDVASVAGGEVFTSGGVAFAAGGGVFEAGAVSFGASDAALGRKQTPLGTESSSLAASDDAAVRKHPARLRGCTVAEIFTFAKNFMPIAARVEFSRLKLSSDYH
jgi:hypothetical protein